MCVFAMALADLFSIKYGALALLVLQNTFLVIFMRYSRTQAGPLYASSTAVFMMEVFTAPALQVNALVGDKILIMPCGCTNRMREYWFISQGSSRRAYLDRNLKSLYSLFDLHSSEQFAVFRIISSGCGDLSSLLSGFIGVDCFIACSLKY